MKRPLRALLAAAVALASCQTRGTSPSNPPSATSQGLATIALPPQPSRTYASPTITSAPLVQIAQSPTTATPGETPPVEIPCIEVDFSAQPLDIPPRLVLLDDGLLRSFDFPEEGARTLGRESFVAALSNGNHSPSPDARTLAFIETSPDPSGIHEETRELRLASGLARLPFSWPETWLYIMGWAADGRLALMTPRSAPGAVTLVDLETKTTQRLEPLLNAPCEWGEGRFTPILYSPDLASVVYPTNVTDTLCDCARCEWGVADAESGHIYWSAPSVEWPRWSPDGSRVAFTAQSGILDQALIAVSSSGEPTFLTSPDTKSPNRFPSIVAPSWSPDSRYIAAWAGHYGQYDTLESFSLVVVDVQGQAIRNYCITTEPIPYYDSPVWSPDGEWLAVRTYAYFLDRYPPSEEHLALLDLNTGKGFRIESSMPVVAWLAEK